MTILIRPSIHEQLRVRMPRRLSGPHSRPHYLVKRHFVVTQKCDMWKQEIASLTIIASWEAYSWVGAKLRDLYLYAGKDDCHMFGPPQWNISGFTVPLSLSSAWQSHFNTLEQLQNCFSNVLTVFFLFFTHLYLLLFGRLISGDLICFFFLAWFLFLLFDYGGGLQLVVHEVFERVQVSFSFVLVCLQKHPHTNKYLAAVAIDVEAVWIVPPSYEFFFNLDLWKSTLTPKGWSYFRRSLYLRVTFIH